MSESLRNKYEEWFFTKTPEEDYLQRKAFEYEEKYFSDMTMRDFEKVLSVELCDINGKHKEVWGDISEPGDLTIDGWRFIIVKNPKGYSGKCIPGSKTIKIGMGDEDKDAVLLHEMVHAYETMLSDIVYVPYLQFILIELYEKLSPRIKDLKQLIIKDLHVNNFVHSPLFMLKSIDLDLQLNKPLGTIYGYERNFLFSMD